MRVQSVVLLALMIGAASASAQTNVANYNLNPLSRAYASDSGAYGGRPSGPINGDSYPGYNYDGNFHHSSTNSGGVQLDLTAANPWWYVDLGGNFDISQVIFYYRQGCCEAQNDGDILRVWSSLPDFSGGTPLFSAILTYSGNPSDSFLFGTPLTARYVSIQADAGGAIVFPELEVMGTPSRVTATPEPASLVLMASGLAGLAIVSRRRQRGKR